MIPTNTCKTLLSMATLMAMAFSAHANPRGVDPSKDAQNADELSIEIPADMLSTDTLHMDSVPVIDVEEIAVFDMPGEHDSAAPESWQIENALDDLASADTHKHQRPEGETAWRTESPDLGVELPVLEFDQDLHDDVRMPEVTPRIELDVPAPAITLDF